MKKIMLAGLLLYPLLWAAAQTPEEWLEQKQTQKKYLLEQIAALKAYGSYVQKGYAIAASGWRTIRGIKEGEISGHRAFFSALSAVNPAVSASPFARGAVALHARILEQISAIRTRLNASRQLTTPESGYCHRLLDGLTGESYYCREELIFLTTPGRVELSDEGRLQRLGRLYEQMQQLYTLAATLGAEIEGLTARRWREQTEVERSKNILGQH